MKQYLLDIQFDEENHPSIFEKVDKGFTVNNARMTVALLEEYKQRLITFIFLNAKPIDLKDKPKND